MPATTAVGETARSFTLPIIISSLVVVFLGLERRSARSDARLQSMTFGPSDVVEFK